MMKSLIVLLVALSAISARAVVIQWTLPNSAGGPAWVQSVQADTSAYNLVWIAGAEKTSAGDVITGMTGATNATVQGILPAVEQPVLANWEITATFDGAGSTWTGGYFYLVVFNPANHDEYAVAGGKTYVAGNPGSTGIYENTVGELPEGGDYLDLGAWMPGSNWSAATVPEPTVLALLALGVAGLALRRRTV